MKTGNLVLQDQSIQEMYSREMFATNHTFQEGHLIVIICFQREILTKRPLFKGS